MPRFLKVPLDLTRFLKVPPGLKGIYVPFLGVVVWTLIAYIPVQSLTRSPLLTFADVMGYHAVTVAMGGTLGMLLAWGMTYRKTVESQRIDDQHWEEVKTLLKAIRDR